MSGQFTCKSLTVHSGRDLAKLMRLSREESKRQGDYHIVEFGSPILLYYCDASPYATALCSQARSSQPSAFYGVAHKALLYSTTCRAFSLINKLNQPQPTDGLRSSQQAPKRGNSTCLYFSAHRLLLDQSLALP